MRDLDGLVLRKFEEETSTGNWSWVEDYVWREGKLASSDSAADGRLFYHLDHLGTPRWVTNSAGGFVRRHDYFPFGEEYLPVNVTEPMRFTGHERDFGGMGGADRGGDLDYMHARYFSPALGSFMSMDSLRGNPMKPQTWNRYSYVQNQPINFVDSTGLYREDFHGGGATEVIALAAGFSPAEARNIAAETQAVDTDPARSPTNIGAVADGSLELFHFASDDRLGELFVQALTTRNARDIGTLLHAGQDRFSHEGYTAGIGAGSAGVPGPGHLLAGTAPDLTANDPARAVAAAEWTYNALTLLRGARPAVPFSAISGLLLRYFSREEEWTDERERDLALIRARIRENARGSE